MSDILEQGVDNWADIAHTLNNIILQSGPIDINNKLIWDGYLHQWTNKEWGAMLVALGTLITDHPGIALPFHVRAWEQARDAYISCCDTDPRCMDSKSNKKYAWKAIMAMRELYNAANNINLPNQ